MPELDPRQLRKLAFEVSVVADRDFITDDEGIHLLPAPPTATSPALPEAQPVVLTWEVVTQALAHQPEGATSTDLRHTLRALLDDIDCLSSIPAAHLQHVARPYALPTGSPLHLGPAWVQQPVLGGALDLGLAFALDEEPAPDSTQAAPREAVRTFSPGAFAALQLPVHQWWPQAQHYLDTMGQTAATALAQMRTPPATSTASRRPQAVLRPYGDADVLTLLGSRAYRQALAQRDKSGLCAAAVPMRRRGWIDLSTLDPAFVPTAYELTDPPDRGFPRPVLVTADEVVFRP